MEFPSDEEVASFRNSGQLDQQWYLEQYPDVKLAGVDPVKHFLWIGKKLGRRPMPAHIANSGMQATVGAQPNHAHDYATGTTSQRQSTPVLNSSAQVRRATSAQIASAQQRRLGHLIAAHQQVLSELENARVLVRGRIPDFGQKRKTPFRRRHRVSPKSSSHLFDRAWVKRQSPAMFARSLRDYLRNPAYHSIDPHPLFAAADYLTRYPDVAAAGISPLQHYFEYGWREGRDPHPYFANDWYLVQNPDVLNSGRNPLEHYLEYGWKEGRRPNPVFDPVEYLARYPDVQASGVEPLSHYIMYGRAERREVPFKGFDRDWRSLVPYSSEAHLMDHLLSGQVPVVALEQSAFDTEASWPPQPLNGYWPAQSLRDFILETYGEGTLQFYWYLYSVMDGFSDRPEDFVSSDAFQRIISRIREKSAARVDDPSAKPAASIIIPVFNNFLDTLLCVTSILESETTASFEIIVADDCSNDATESIIPTIGGVVRHLRHPENLGFLGNCNAAAAVASGDTIVFLNNDTLVLPGWLDALLAPFSRSSQVGLVGSKLINWDGSLQEAGGIYWSDGSAWNFGRGQDPRAPQFNYVKDTDYCSGASIAVPAALWRRLDGFDSIYSPAYCEDADLAFRIRGAGFRTLYNPHSEVIHHEGRSHGRDITSGIKAYQVTNLQRLVERWGDLLRSEHYPNAQNVLLARDRSRNKKHILVIDHYVPQWDQDAGSRTILQYLEIFIDLGFQVTFWPDNLFFDPVYAPVLQSMGVEVIHGPRYLGGFGDFIRERADLYDAVFLSRPHVAVEYLPLIKSHSQARILYYGHDLHFKRMQASRDLGVAVDEDSIAQMRELELRVCNDSDVIFYPDPDELKLIANEIEGDRAYIANPVFVYDDTRIASGYERVARTEGVSDSALLFVGGFNHTPNGEGVLWFVEHVLPLIADKMPQVKLDVAGSNPPPEIVALASERVSILGRVSDEKLDDLYRTATLAVAPLRHGAGVKGKVIEAMAAGVPVATTSVGAQGIDIGEEGLFIGDQPRRLADEIIRCLSDRTEATRRAQNALAFIKRRYGRSDMMNLFQRLIVENADA